MKHTIICCDLCKGRIYKDRFFKTEEGAVAIKARELRWLNDMDLGDFPAWVRCEYHICPKCVERLKKICGGAGG